MSHTFLTSLILLFVFPFTSCSQINTPGAADKPVGGSCEGCEAIYESPVPFSKLRHTDTLPDYFERGSRLVVSGVVYKADGITPAPNVVLYVYHTNQQGLYSKGGKGWGKQHGSIRGWVRTNEKGEYRFYTLIPASYPNSTMEKHIHPTIKEEGFKAYYIDEFTFDDDKYLTAEKRNRMELRGGNGVLTTELKNGMYYATRNIYLGRNIPDYPQQKTGLQSGLERDDNCPAFEPIHLSGADVGSDACPMCKYGYGAGVMIWMNHTSFDTLKNFVRLLEKEMQLHGPKQFRVFLVYMNPTHKQNDGRRQETLQAKITSWCKEQRLKQVAVLWISSPEDENCKLYHMNPKATNTVLTYRKRKVVDKWVNMPYEEASVKKILLSLQLTERN